MLAELAAVPAAPRPLPWLQRLLSVGVPDGADDESRRRARVVNVLLGFGFAATLLFVAADLLARNWTDLPVSLATLVAGGGVLGLHAAGFRSATRLSMAVVGTASLFVSAATTAHEDFGSYQLLVMPPVALILFEPEERLRRWLFALLPLALFLQVEGRIGQLPGLTPGAPSDWLKLGNLLLATVFPTLVVAHLVSTQMRVRRQLEDGVRTLRERQAQLAQSSRLSALGEMAAGVAHEVNNPLTAVLLNAERVGQLLDAGSAQAGEAADRLERALSASRRISRIVGALLTFARQDRAEPPRPVRARALVDESLSGLGVTVELRVPEALILLCHGPDVVQVLRHLLTNARDAVAGQGDGAILLSAEVAGGEARLCVEDDGPGIPPELRGRLMEPFATGKAAGTGLGLALSRALIQGNGGRLTFDADAPRTRFVVQLPVAPEGA